MAQKTAEDVPEFVEEIERIEFAEFGGMSEDGERFMIRTDRIRSLTTNIALRNGYIVDEVQNAASSCDYDKQVVFSQLQTA